MLEAEAEDNYSSRPTIKFWPRGQLVLDDLTSLLITHLCMSAAVNHRCVVYMYVAERYDRDFLRVKNKKSVDIFAYYSKDHKDQYHFSENLPSNVKLSK